jgi:hypothetical protein
MKKFKAVLLGIFISQFIYSQSCLPGGINLNFQYQVDNFQADYPGCSEILGDVKIGPDVENLQGLSVLTSIGVDLRIYPTNYNLQNLTGLNNLNYIGGNINFQNCLAMTGLNGLEALDSIGGDLIINGMDVLTSLEGLAGLNIVNGNLKIMYTAALVSLSGLENLVKTGGEITITSNQVLADLTGLDYLDPGSISLLKVTFNPNLQNCDIKSVCDYLTMPGSDVEIGNNATGCNSPQEVLDECTVGAAEPDNPTSGQLSVTIYPDQNGDMAGCRLWMPDAGRVKLSIYDVRGSKMNSNLDEMKPAGESYFQINTATLRAGIYIYRLNANGETISGKLVLIK